MELGVVRLPDVETFRGPLKIPGPEGFQLEILIQLVCGNTQHISTESILSGSIGCVDIETAGHTHAATVTNRHGILGQVRIDGLTQNPGAG